MKTLIRLKPYIIVNVLCLLTGTVGKARACAGIGCVGKEEAGRERVVLLALDAIGEDAVAEFVVLLPVAFCCIWPIFPRSRFCNR